MKLFKNKRVIIMGLGLLGGGIGVAKFFYKQGAKVLVTDLKTKEQLLPSIKKLRRYRLKYVLGGHREQDFLNTDLVIKNPAVPNDSPYLKIAREHRIPIETDISVFFDLCKAQIIGITGTKGKSTAATLIYQFLKKRYPVVLAGNIGVSPLEVLSKIKKGSKVVLELSSFELEGLEKSPEIAVITTLFPDHLNRYESFSDYVEAKKPIFKHQKGNGILVLNYDNSQTRRLSYLASSQVYFFSKSAGEIDRMACFVEKEEIFFNEEKHPVCSLNDLKVYGSHNLSNVLAAVSVAKLLRVSSEEIKEVLLKFEGIADRQELIKEKRGVKYFNDTTATTPDSAIAAVKTLKKRFPDSKIVIITGGEDKNLNYKDLAKEIKKSIAFVVLLPGTASDKIKKEVKRVKIFPAKSMERAVKKATKLAKKGDIVLLSPAAASFNLFKNEFDRGEQFNKLVRKLKK